MQRFVRKPHRIPPKMATNKYKTFASRSPLDSHWKHASCEEFGCKAFREGWSLRVEDLDPQLNHLARHSGRKFREVRIAEGETYLVYDAGQACFDAHNHRVPLDRPAIYLVGRGDWRSFDPRQATRLSAENFVDAFANQLDTINTAIERG